MLRYLNLVVWDSTYKLALDKPKLADILEISKLLEAISNLSEDNSLDLRVYTFAVDVEEDMQDDEMLEIISENLPAMLKDSTIVISDYGEYTLKGIARSSSDESQHLLDCKRYYTKHPFM